MRPPTHIDGATVLEWAWSESPFGTVPFVDGSGAVSIHGLAICRYGDAGGVYRFSCNRDWETEQDGLYSSVAEAKSSLPTQYREVAADWHLAELAVVT